MGAQTRHHADMVQHFKKMHQKRVDGAAVAVSGAKIVKKDTGVTVGKNNVIPKQSPQAKSWNGDQSNLDNRLAGNEKPFAKKFYNTRVNKNI